LFNIGDQLVFDVEQALPFSAILRMTAYGIIYTLAFILLAQVNFRRREI
jgi:hypothetical protein